MKKEKNGMAKYFKCCLFVCHSIVVVVLVVLAAFVRVADVIELLAGSGKCCYWAKKVEGGSEK